MTNDDMSLYINQSNENLKAPIFIASGNTKKKVISNIAVGNKKFGSLWGKQAGSFYLNIF